MTEPVKDMPRTEAAMKWGCVAAPFIAILLVVLYANDMLNFSKPANPDQEFAERAMASARDAMKDPTSVKFKDLTVSAKARCMYGQILAKNGFGAYTGYQSFVWKDGKTYIDPGEIQSNVIVDNAGDYVSYMRAKNQCMSVMPIGEGYMPLSIPEA